MSDQQGSSKDPLDPLISAETMASITERSQRLIAQFLDKQAKPPGDDDLDPLNIGPAFVDAYAKMMANPEKLLDSQMSFWRDYIALCQSTLTPKDQSGKAPDRRFRGAAWSNNDIFEHIKKSYLLSARWLQSTMGDIEGLDEKTAKKVNFYTRQFTDALSPGNFLITNPEVLEAIRESGGKNLVTGLENLLRDLERGHGQLKASMSDETAFEVGRNIAVTPGKVIFRNDLMELIQYNPTTKTVFKRPLLIVTPWINKYYVLDMRPDNSFIRWAVDQGHTVFITSWVNPDEKLAQKKFDDYMIEGPLAALDAIKKATGEKQVNIIGYCIGGTLLASTLAYMAAKKDRSIASATFLTSLVDFSEPGDLGIFIDEKQIDTLENKMTARGYLEGDEMSTAFSMMRSNDLIWSFVINNYLLGKVPAPFDLLYWNADSTRLPATMHCFYLRRMYLENKLIEPGGITLAGQPLDLRDIKTPTYILSTREDHIAPWRSTYAATGLYQGPRRFVLSGSGHIAGVVNPPAANKYSYWTNDKLPASADDWLDGATETKGSWWTDWQKWVAKHKVGKKVPARKPGGGVLKPLADAPGDYVRMRSDKT